MNRTRHLIALTALLALALGGTAPAAVKTTPWVGRTKEGSKITFKLDRRNWVRGLETLAPMSCGSAQGGDPQGRLVTYEPPFMFKLGSRIRSTSTDGITKHWNITTRRRGRRTITGRLEANWSLLSSDGWGGYRIFVCETTSSFTAHPRR